MLINNHIFAMGLLIMGIDVADDDYGLAEPEHLETMFEALNDTVAGNESLSLTSAQRYASVVLTSAGLISQKDLVTGNEGFFSAIGEGVTKIWEYIKKMFQGIWNWLFGKKEKGPSIAEQTEAIVKHNQETIQALIRTDTTFNKEIAKSYANLAIILEDFTKTADSSDKRKAEEGVAILKKAKELPVAKQAVAVKEATEIVAKINRKDRKAIETLCEQAAKNNQQYLAIVNEDHSSSFEDTTYKEYYSKFSTWSKEFRKVAVDSYLDITKNINTLSQAEQAQKGLLEIITDVKLEIAAISSTFQTSINSKIKATEMLLSKSSVNEKGKETLSRELTACKLFLSLTTKHVKQLERTQETVKRLSNMIIRLFGIKS